MCAQFMFNRFTPCRVLAICSHDSNRLSVQLVMGWLLFTIVFTSLVTGCNRTMAQEAPMPALPETGASDPADSDADQSAAQLLGPRRGDAEGRGVGAGTCMDSGRRCSLASWCRRRALPLRRRDDAQPPGGVDRHAALWSLDRALASWPRRARVFREVLAPAVGRARATASRTFRDPGSSDLRSAVTK